MPIELDDLSEAAAILDAEGRIEECNRSWRRRCSRRNVLRQLAEIAEGRNFAAALSRLLSGRGEDCSSEFSWPPLGRVRARAHQLQKNSGRFLLRLDEVPGQFLMDSLRALLDQMPEAVFLLDPLSGRTLYANAALLGLLELQTPPGDSESSLYGSLFASESLREMAPRLQVTGPLNLEITQRTSRGRRFPAQVQILPVAGPPHTLLAVFLSDLTESQRQMRLLQSASSRLQTILDTSPLAVVTLTNEGLVSSWNPAAERIYGWSQSEVIRRPSPFSGELAPEVVRQMILEKASLNVRLRRRCKDGEFVDISLSFCPLMDDSGVSQGLLEMGEDITDQVNADRMANNLRLFDGREAERLSLAREIHDGPLQDLLVLGLALQEVDAGSRALGAVKQICQDLRAVLTRLRPAALQELGLVGCLEEMVARLAAEYTRPPATCLMLEEIPGLGPELQLSLLRIVQEAYQNCLRHAQASSVEITLRMQAGQVQLVVADNGTGFSLVDREMAESYGLLGIRERVALCGGQCQIQGEPGRGTRLEVGLPLRIQEGP